MQGRLCRSGGGGGGTVSSESPSTRVRLWRSTVIADGGTAAIIDRRDCCAALADRIEVPNYKSKAELLHYLRIAITMERTGFGID